MWFLFVGAELCFQLPSDETSRLRPCLLLALLATKRAVDFHHLGIGHAWHTKKNPATYFLYAGIQMRTAAANCNTPNPFQRIGEILLSKEQGGSKNDKNLSKPTMTKRRLQIATMIFITFISVYFYGSFTTDRITIAISTL